MSGGGEFIVSLDFELLWGVRDHADRASYGCNVLGAREAIPRMLDAFERSGIQATWATVGFLFCATRDELLASLPAEELRPRYADLRLSSYSYLDEVGRDEASDPYYFGASLVRRILDTPGQEVGTHTLSHFYCLEPGATVEAFAADLAAAVSLATQQGIQLRSIVFPRNQYAPKHLEAVRAAGIETFRGTPRGWAYAPTNSQGNSLLRRGLRLMDAYTGALSHESKRRQQEGLQDAPASRFLRPRQGRLAVLHPRHVATVCAGLRQAARTGASYHLWWHPHNFGVETDANMAGLERILAEFRRARDERGMISRPMGSP